MKTREGKYDLGHGVKVTRHQAGSWRPWSPADCRDAGRNLTPRGQSEQKEDRGGAALCVGPGGGREGEEPRKRQGRKKSLRATQGVAQHPLKLSEGQDNEEGWRQPR